MSTFLVYVGCYGTELPSPAGESGGVHVFQFDPQDASFASRGKYAPGLRAGYLCCSPDARRLYVVDERKNDGRGPVGPAASVGAYSIERPSGALKFLNAQPAFGAYPTYVDVDPTGSRLVTASHGSFDHVEHVVRTAAGFAIENSYDDSTVALYPLSANGELLPPCDIQVLSGHGIDPCDSPQAGGHAQASAHAHSATVDPSGRFVVVCDKGTDRILVYRLDPRAERLQLAYAHSCPPGTAPRLPAFHTVAPIVLVVNELASTLSSFAFDASRGSLALLDSTPTAPDYAGNNEPADVQIHPLGRLVYVNNRGRDDVAWFRLDLPSGRLSHSGSVAISRSEHPGLAARSMAFDPSGKFLLVADRPANRLLAYRVDPASGDLVPVGVPVPVPGPAFVRCLVF
jgi:6-phosphogluconolactonase